MRCRRSLRGEQATSYRPVHALTAERGVPDERKPVADVPLRVLLDQAVEVRSAATLDREVGTGWVTLTEPSPQFGSICHHPRRGLFTRYDRYDSAPSCGCRRGEQDAPSG